MSQQHWRVCWDVSVSRVYQAWRGALLSLHARVNWQNHSAKAVQKQDSNNRISEEQHHSHQQPDCGWCRFLQLCLRENSHRWSRMQCVHTCCKRCVFPFAFLNPHLSVFSRGSKWSSKFSGTHLNLLNTSSTFHREIFYSEEFAHKTYGEFIMSVVYKICPNSIRYLILVIFNIFIITKAVSWVVVVFFLVSFNMCVLLTPLL